MKSENNLTEDSIMIDDKDLKSLEVNVEDLEYVVGGKPHKTSHPEKTQGYCHMCLLQVKREHSLYKYEKLKFCREVGHIYVDDVYLRTSVNEVAHYFRMK